MRNDCYFVTGTDTGIGKTVVSAILAIGLKSHYWKPIQTGSDEGTDSEFVGKWIGQDKVWPESYIFPEPVSPHLAAEIKGTEISLKKCLGDFLKHHKPTIIEGAGGVLVPINSSALMIDFISALGVPTIVVASTRLGTINHTLLTLEALKNRDIQVAGVITVGTENHSTLKAIENYGRTLILGHVAPCEAFSMTWFKETYKQLSIPKLRSEPCAMT